MTAPGAQLVEPFHLATTLSGKTCDSSYKPDAMVVLEVELNTGTNRIEAIINIHFRNLLIVGTENFESTEAVRYPEIPIHAPMIALVCIETRVFNHWCGVDSKTFINFHTKVKR